MNIPRILSREFRIQPCFINNVISLFQEKATIPFIARYRKEATGGQDETFLRKFLERFDYLSGLKERKASILKTIKEQGRLTTPLLEKIEGCSDKSELEDIYLPYKPKRKTRASVAKEKGLEPLLKGLLDKARDPSCIPEEEAEHFLDPEKGVNSVEDALQGASDLYAGIVAEKPGNRKVIREYLVKEGKFVSRARPAFKGKKSKYEMYYDYRVPVKKIASHNMLAMRRGEKEGALFFDVQADPEKILEKLYTMELRAFDTPVSSFLKNSIKDSYSRLMKPSICSEIRIGKKKEADLDAIATFENNLRSLLLSPPSRALPVLAIDPGFTTGCKVAALSGTGKFLEHSVIFPTGSIKQKKRAKETLFRLITTHFPRFIAIGNGTASRETERFVKQFLREQQRENSPQVLFVCEAGASVYSASESAIQEFPDKDISVRGAISIGRRLLNPLAELVKIDPKAIGVGQYQHDMDQALLKKKLEDVVESCVNFVGVDVNTASYELLCFVSGINSSVAQNIVKRVKEKGPLKTRQELMKVTGVGKKVFEQASGFLRIKNGANPLDDTSVHPERYGLVKKIAAGLGVSEKELIGSKALLDKIVPLRFADETTGRFTLSDIVSELEKPGQDPGADFTYARFDEKVHSIADLSEGMELQGVVTNVANFGAFVDIGVHQDGLVHVSKLNSNFVKNPRDVVRVGEQVQVTVLKIDRELKRISLSML
ncbi:MAG: Tex family protein [Nitrospinota bacterium]